jgi:DNA end-binding protein Ku
MGTLLRYPYEVRSEQEYFEDIQDVKITKDMLDLAKHIVEQKSGSFEPEEFEDRYEQALIDLINQKRNGLSPKAQAAPKSGGNVINLMDALKRSLASEKEAAPARAQEKSQEKSKGKKPKKAAAGQREMLLPISGGGKRAAKETAKEAAKEAPKKAEKPVRSTARAKKAG